jgi:hypothetical protein
MDQLEIATLFAAKQLRRGELARLPIEEKLRAVVRLQELAAPILQQRGKPVHRWQLDPRPPAGKSC